MPDDATIKARAREHQRALTETRFLSVRELAARWHVGETLVRDIPAADLPYLEFGNGTQKRRRRFDPADVERYERQHRRAAAA